MSLASQLLRHRDLTAIDRETVWTSHPGVWDSRLGRKVVPTAWDGSVYLNAYDNKYGDKMLPDGRTIVFHPSNSSSVNAKLSELAGKDVALYAFVGRNTYRTGRVRVEKAQGGVYHLKVHPRQDSSGGAPGGDERIAWADMD
jgi:hypothetical protein